MGNRCLKGGQGGPCPRAPPRKRSEARIHQKQRQINHSVDLLEIVSQKENDTIGCNFTAKKRNFSARTVYIQLGPHHKLFFSALRKKVRRRDGGAASVRTFWIKPFRLAANVSSRCGALQISPFFYRKSFFLKDRQA